MYLAISFPPISPEIFSLDIGGFTFALRWYALGYVVGLLIAWKIISSAITTRSVWPQQPPMSLKQLEDLMTWLIFGIIFGGRFGYVIFYQPAYYLENPGEILMIWQGGMSFHGGFLGVVIAGVVYCIRHKLNIASVADLLAIASPIGIGLVRITNFINAELWGRPTELPWGVIFPTADAQFCPDWSSILEPCARHPSQLYEAALEGLLLATILLTLAFKRRWFRFNGALCGLFFIGYGMSRFIVEFFRQADSQFITSDNPFGYAFQLGEWGLTMGQTLSLPMILVGAVILIYRHEKAA